MPVFLSPAKLNLFFRVLHRREDGFHEIASLYQAISLFDRIEIEFAECDHFTCSDPSLLMDDSNLVLKALRLFRKETKIDTPVRIHLEKKIPMQAGLGGGSSNAATVLFALKQLSSCDFDFGVSSVLGSDVPFFFSTGTAFCTGRGEKIVSLEKLPWDQGLWVAKPRDLYLSTPRVYGACRPLQFLPRDPEVSLKKWQRGEIELYNDLEIPACELCRELVEVKKGLLEAGFSLVAMTGSGTAFFCIGDVESPQMPGVDCQRVSFCRRQDLGWYELS